METVAPESVGMSTDRLNNLHTIMQGFVDQGKIAGIATLVARHGKVVQFGCYGKLDLAANRPITSNSLFRIYSLTKPITSVAALILYEEGYFALDDSVTRWIPEFTNFQVLQESVGLGMLVVPQSRDITIWHLLTHTAGLGYGFMIEPIEAIYRDAQILSPIGTLQVPLAEMIQKVSKLPLATQPGEAWHYSLAHDILGYLIERISGKPFDVFLRERIFEPLGMEDTGFFVPQGKLERFGPLYSPPNAYGLAVLDDVTGSPFVRPDTAPSGGGGLVSSIQDYYRFLTMLANGGEFEGYRVLKQSTVTAMTTNQLTEPLFPIRFFNEPVPGLGFGLGIGVHVEDRPHVGWFGASGTTAWIFPREEMIAIAMPQAYFYFDIREMFLDMATEAIMED